MPISYSFSNNSIINTNFSRNRIILFHTKTTIRYPKYKSASLETLDFRRENMSARLVLTVKDSNRMAKDLSMSVMDKMFHPLSTIK